MQVLGSDADPITTLTTGAVFGELAFLRGFPRSASVVAQSCATVWALDHANYLHILNGALAGSSDWVELRPLSATVSRDTSVSGNAEELTRMMMASIDNTSGVDVCDEAQSALISNRGQLLADIQRRDEAAQLGRMWWLSKPQECIRRLVHCEETRDALASFCEHNRIAESSTGLAWLAQASSPSRHVGDLLDELGVEGKDKSPQKREELLNVHVKELMEQLLADGALDVIATEGV